jgi:hypothetical protein
MTDKKQTTPAACLTRRDVIKGMLGAWAALGVSGLLAGCDGSDGDGGGGQAAIPLGAATIQLAVPAFWTLESKYQPFWQQLRNTSSALAVTIIAQDWPAVAQQDPGFKTNAQKLIDSLPGSVLGYVSTRNGGPSLLPTAEILGGASKADSVRSWYDQFGQQLDGIYFDELVVPDDPSSVSVAQALVADFKAAHIDAQVMILAGQCIDESVVGPDIDWALLWETAYPAPRQLHRLHRPEQHTSAVLVEEPRPSTEDPPCGSRLPRIGTAARTWPCERAQRRRRLRDGSA